MRRTRPCRDCRSSPALIAPTWPSSPSDPNSSSTGRSPSPTSGTARSLAHGGRSRSSRATVAGPTASSTPAREIGDRMLAGGFSSGSVVGVCLERSVDAIATQLAIVTLGGAWVALDPGSPQRVLDHILGDSGASMVVTTSRHADRIAGTTTVVHVDAPGRVEPRQRDRAMRPRAHDIACLIYTSGSTGHPKGVMVEHRGIHNRLAWMWQAFPFEAGEVLALKTAPSFVDSIWETFGPLLAGVPAVVLTDDTARDPRRARRCPRPPRCHPAARRAVAAASTARQRARDRPRTPPARALVHERRGAHARSRRAVRRVPARP